jgi:hypothetical protein
MVACFHHEGRASANRRNKQSDHESFQGSFQVTGVVSGLAASVGIAIVITSLTLEKRKSKEVIDSTANGAVRLVEAALGQNP